MNAVGHVVKELTVKIDADGSGSGAAVEYQCAVTGVDESVTRTTQTTNVACPDGSITDTGPASYELVIGLNVDMKAGSLYRILRDNDGVAATIDVEYDPIHSPGVVTAYAVTLLDPGHSAQVAAWHTATATLPVRGRPTITDPAPLVAPAPAPDDDPVVVPA
jgi:hypothetical protein